eukprot:TRINITY_DN16256_c0_g1_i2.p1 TRINITY_DN16256_c0_g1~~TRINITY_DN16256_c0_g1_i2.p1  ORF type:complete len:982 (+),score=308.41 TRINITY_DN16256_c0_g1_i2:77-3022(+)
MPPARCAARHPPATEGGGEYLRNTTLRRPLKGYSRRWKHYAGCLSNRAGPGHLKGRAQPRELSRGSWFAVPQVGRFQPGCPHFHVVTANHVMHPFWYPEFYPMGKGEKCEWLNLLGHHDTEPFLLTPSPDGQESHRKFHCAPDWTYADPRKHLDIAVIHPTPDDTGAMLRANFSHELRDASGPEAPAPPGALRGLFGGEENEMEEYFGEDMDGDAQNYPFHFQLLSFDCRPLEEGELVSVHGHALVDDVALRPLMLPTVVRARVRREERGAPAGFIFVEPQSELSEGVCGGPVLRDGRVVGMLTASVRPEAPHYAGCGMVTPAAAIREFLLQIEEKWRWPDPPPAPWLAARGLLTGPMAPPRRIAGAGAPECGAVPRRYLPPDFLPQPVTSAEVRDTIYRKFNDPLPPDFMPPALPGQEPFAISRDSTNPFGELPPDSGIDIPSLHLFPGYLRRPEVGWQGFDDGAEKAWWLIKYGSEENYLRAHGVDPSLLTSGEVKRFRNYIGPWPGEKGWGLFVDGATDPDAKVYLPSDEPAEDQKLLDWSRDGTLPPPAAELPTLSRKGMEDLGMEHFFGEDEYSAHRAARRRREAALIEAERREYLDRGEPVPEEVERRMAAFLEREEALAWHRGDREYISPERAALEARARQEELARLDADSRTALPAPQGEDDGSETVSLSSEPLPQDVEGASAAGGLGTQSTGERTELVALSSDEAEAAQGTVVPAEIETLEQSIERRVEEAVREARQRSAGPEPPPSPPPPEPRAGARAVPVQAPRRDAYVRDIPWGAPQVADYAARAAGDAHGAAPAASSGGAAEAAAGGAAAAAAEEEIDPLADSGDVAVELGDPLAPEFATGGGGLTGRRVLRRRPAPPGDPDPEPERGSDKAPEQQLDEVQRKTDEFLRSAADDASLAPDLRHNLRRMRETLHGGEEGPGMGPMREKHQELLQKTQDPAQRRALQERMRARLRPVRNAFDAPPNASGA